MFLQLSVSHSFHGGFSVWCHSLSGCLVSCSFWGVLSLVPCSFYGSRGSLSRGVSVWVVPVQGVSVYGVFIGSQIRKAGGTHPTGMHCCLLFWSLSCYKFFFRTLLALNSKGLGVPVIASFENGIVFKFVKGQPLSDEQMRDKRIMRYDPALISHFTSN